MGETTEMTDEQRELARHALGLPNAKHHATAFGGGYVLRSAAEFYLVGTIGRPAVLSRSVRNLIDAPLREHSRKPDQLHHDVERLYAGPYAELFAREGRPGWDVWGNQTAKFDADKNSTCDEATGENASFERAEYV